MTSLSLYFATATVMLKYSVDVSFGLLYVFPAVILIDFTNWKAIFARLRAQKKLSRTLTHIFNCNTKIFILKPQNYFSCLECDHVLLLCKWHIFYWKTYMIYLTSDPVRPKKWRFVLPPSPFPPTFRRTNCRLMEWNYSGRGGLCLEPPITAALIWRIVFQDL